MYDLIKEAADAGVLLFVENGKLGFKLTAAEFPAALKQRIVANKADIVEFLSKHQEAAQNKLPELVAVPRESERVNASFAQQRLWFLDEMEGGSGFYNMPFTRFFERDFDLAIAEKALNAILERHEVLRTYYEGEAGQCVQVIRDTWDFSIRQQDFSEANEAQLEDDLRAAISEESFRRRRGKSRKKKRAQPSRQRRKPAWNRKRPRPQNRKLTRPRRRPRRRNRRRRRAGSAG